MSQEKESTLSSGKAKKRYVYLNKFLDYKEETETKFVVVDKLIKLTNSRIRWLLIGLTCLTVILTVLILTLTSN